MQSNLKKLQILQQQLNVINDEYMKIMSNKWSMKLPIDRFRSSLKQKIFNINNAIVQISKNNMESHEAITSLTYDK